jgi:hypothetical protein
VFPKIAVQNYEKGIIRARKIRKKFPFLQKIFFSKIKKFSKTFYNTLIFSVSVCRIEEKVSQNEICARYANSSLAYCGVVLVHLP